MPSARVLAQWILTGVVSVCAITVTALAVRHEIGGRGTTYNWREYADGGHWIGSRDAKVVAVEFADFQCPACRALAGQFQQLREKYPADFAFVFRHWALGGRHPFAREAALASECAARQGRFANMHDVLFGHADSIGIRRWSAFAADAGVPDMEHFNRCLSDSSVAAAVDRDALAASKLGGRGTPTFILNGKRITGVPMTGVLDSIVRVALRD
jgi:protein-disulfide isomerase